MRGFHRVGVIVAAPFAIAAVVMGGSSTLLYGQFSALREQVSQMEPPPAHMRIGPDPWVQFGIKPAPKPAQAPDDKWWLDDPLAYDHSVVIDLRRAASELDSALWLAGAALACALVAYISLVGIGWVIQGFRQS